MGPTFFVNAKIKKLPIKVAEWKRGSDCLQAEMSEKWESPFAIPPPSIAHNPACLGINLQLQCILCIAVQIMEIMMMSANETGGGFIKLSFKRHMIWKLATLVVNSLSRQAAHWRPGCPRCPRESKVPRVPKVPSWFPTYLNCDFCHILPSSPWPVLYLFWPSK